MDIGKRLQEIRKCKHISIYRLSQKSEVSESHIRNLESGKKARRLQRWKCWCIAWI